MTGEIVLFSQQRPPAGLGTKWPTVFLPNEKAAERFFGFFTANIRNKNTRRPYYEAACRFSDWCEGLGTLDLANVKPPHVAAYTGIQGHVLGRACDKTLFYWSSKTIPRIGTLR